MPPQSKTSTAKPTRKKALQKVKGTKDILPNEQPWWDFWRKVSGKIIEGYGFSRIQTPIIETTDVFSRSIGQTTEVIEKQMFSFTDKGREKISLRPENTAGVVRAYIENGMHNLPQPVKVFYEGPMFRYEQPQAGRQRQFNQFGLEVFGSPSPAIDVQLIFIANLIFSALKLTGITTEVNSIGCQECRPNYQDALLEYFRGQTSKLCTDCRKRLRTNPLRVLDCKEAKCKIFTAKAPQIVDFLCKPCHRDFKLVLESLDELKIPYELNPSLVRGLDYYSKTVFEFVPNDKKDASQSSIGGGGRYDYLVEMMGGREVPAVGLAFGLERVINLMKYQKVKLPAKKEPQVFLAQLGALGKQKTLALFEDLRKSGIRVIESLGRDSIKSQLKQAGKAGVKLVLIVGQKEALDETILIRDMETGVQEIIKLEKSLVEIKKRLKAK